MARRIDSDDRARAFPARRAATRIVHAKTLRPAGVSLRIGYNPVEGNPYHCEVWGSDPRPEKFTGSQEKSLFKACGWYVPIEGVEIIGGP